MNSQRLVERAARLERSGDSHLNRIATSANDTFNFLDRHEARIATRRYKTVLTTLIRAEATDIEFKADDNKVDQLREKLAKAKRAKETPSRYQPSTYYGVRQRS